MGYQSKERVAWITGASSGIGRATAIEYAKRGFTVAASARRMDLLQHLAREIKEAGGKCLPIACDVRNYKDCQSAVDQTIKTLGRIDVVLADAGYSVIDLFENLSIEDFRRQFETNIMGTLNTLKPALEHIKKSKGHIGLVGSMYGFLGLPRGTAYSMSKFAVRGLADSLVGEVAPHGVSVTHIAPGFVSTDIMKIDRFGEPNKDLAPSPVPQFVYLKPEKAARQIFKAVQGRKREIVVTQHAKIAVLLERYFHYIFHWITSRTAIKLEWSN